MVTYADRPWTKHYDSGVPSQIEYPDTVLHEFLRDRAKDSSHDPALITSAELPIVGRLGKEISYLELDKYSDALAVALIELGLQKGDRVAIVMPNIAGFVISFYAVLKAGGVVAATNPTYPADKMAYQINDSDAKIILTMTLFYETVKSIQNKTKAETMIVTNIKEYLPGPARLLFTIAKEKKEGHRVEQLRSGDYWMPDLLNKYAGQVPNVKVEPEDLALYQYTGGTTGVSKAAMASHRALIANVLQQEAFLMAGLDEDANDVMLGAIPMFHVFGMVSVLSTGIHIGASIVLVPNARDIDDVIGAIEKYQPTLFHGVPALFNAINNHPRVLAGDAKLSSVQLCVSGSAPLPQATKREFEKNTGGRVMEGYGMSEAPTATHVNPVKGENRAGSIGLPLPDVECRIVSLDDGRTDVPVGEPGELIMHSPNLMTGYHGMPTETSNTLHEEDSKTWLHTGDIARMDEDGYFYIVDRKKDMALIGGFNVYPATVEKAIKEHPAVLEVGVAAIPHPEKAGQEALKAWIVLKPDHTATEDEIIKHCEKSLAQYEIPRRISFIDELPKSTVGKTLRRELVRLETESQQ